MRGPPGAQVLENLFAAQRGSCDRGRKNKMIEKQLAMKKKGKGGLDATVKDSQTGRGVTTSRV